MGMELLSVDGSVTEMMHDGDDEYFSDSEAFSSVTDVLVGVAMAPNMVDHSDRDQYDILVSIVDPTQRKDPEEEALLVTALKALTGATFKIDAAFHTSLLSNIFSMNIWNYGFDTRKAVLELIISLAAIPDKFLVSCLHMLVNNFTAPKRIRESIRHPRLAEKRSIYNELYMALHHVVDLVPLAPMILKDIIDKRMPRSTDPKEVIVMFVECMLGLESDEIGEFLGNTLMTKVVELLVDLDVNINWEGILHEEHNKGIFDMDLEDVEENAHSVAGVGTKLSEESGKALNGNVFAEKLDSLMVIVCEHLESCASDGNLVKAFETLAETFRRTVMNAYKSKFVQFVMFYACSLDPEICGLKFAVMLTDIFVSNTEDPISRMSSVAYLASYLSRAKFIPSSLVASILKRLVDWCLEYCQFRDGCERTAYPKAHRVFYSGCQAVMYILCFRMKSLMDVPHLRSQLFHLSLEPILCSSLDPLKVCLPTIVQEFLRQAKAANLFRTSAAFLYNNLLESEFSKAFGGMERLDMFFPFDPYLLKESDRFMRPNFEFWSMVKTTYRNGNSEDEEEEPDAPEDVNNAGPLDDDEDIDPESESDGEVEYSLSKMSITPRPAFHYPKIVDSIQYRGINQVYIIGGDGTQKGAAAIYQEVEKRGIRVAVAGIPKTIDNDIAVIDRSFGFDTAVEEAQRAINAAHVEVESVENGVGIVKLMGRYSGFIAMYASLASRDVRVTETTNVVKVTDRMWARLLASTNQPTFFNPNEEARAIVDKETLDKIDNMRIHSL